MAEKTTEIFYVVRTMRGGSYGTFKTEKAARNFIDTFKRPYDEAEEKSVKETGKVVKITQLTETID